MRRASTIRQVLEFQERHNNSEPEDIWFGKRVVSLPGVRIARKFGGVISGGEIFANKLMGYHVPQGGKTLNHEIWQNKELRKEVLEYCPELSLILDMKLERERCPDDDGHGGRTVQKASGSSPVIYTELDIPVIKPPEPPPFPVMLGAA